MWSKQSRISKNIDNILQHWKNPGFIQDWELHVQDADHGSLKNLLHALGHYAKKNWSKFTALVKSWFNLGLGKMSKILILTVFMEVNML